MATVDKWLFVTVCSIFHLLVSTTYIEQKFGEKKVWQKCKKSIWRNKDWQKH